MNAPVMSPSLDRALRRGVAPVVPFTVAKPSPADKPLRHASHGFHVFRLRDNSKLPAVKGWQEKATTDRLTIETEWTENPSSNIGIATGLPFGGGYLADLDIDVKNGVDGEATLRELEAEHGPLPVTRSQRTATGGRHLLFVTPEPIANSAGTLGRGLDIRGRGGYIVAAGSKIDGAEYTMDIAPIQPMPDWLYLMCKRASAAPAPQPACLQGVDAASATDRAIHYLTIEAPAAIEGEGGDARTFAVAARVKDLGVPDADQCAALMLDHYNPRCVPPWGADELATKVRNSYRYGVEPVGAAAPEAAFTAVEAPTVTANKARFISISDALAGIGPIEWSIDSYLEAQGIGMLWGEPGTWKSFIALDMLLCIGTGHAWHGHAVKQGPVIYFAGEGQRGIARRAAAWAKHNQIELKNAPVLISRSSTNVRDAEVVNAVKEAVDTFGKPPRLIVVDTLHRNFGGGDENSAQDTGTMLDMLDRRISQPLGCAVLLVHHAKKDGQGYRGSSSLKGGLDFEYSVERVGDSVRFTAEKMKDAEFPAPLAFGSARVTIDFDAGIDSLVMVPAAAPVPSKKPRKLREVVAGILMELDRTARPLDGYHDVSKLRQMVVAECGRLGASEPSRQSINRALGELQDSGWLTRETGKVRVNPPSPDDVVGGVVSAVVSAK